MIGKLNLSRDRDAVLGDSRRAEGLFEHDVAPLGAEGHLDRFAQYLYATQDLSAGLDIEFDFLGRHFG